MLTSLHVIMPCQTHCWNKDKLWRANCIAIPIKKLVLWHHSTESYSTRLSIPQKQTSVMQMCSLVYLLVQTSKRVSVQCGTCFRSCTTWFDAVAMYYLVLRVFNSKQRWTENHVALATWWFINFSRKFLCFLCHCFSLSTFHLLSLLADSRTDDVLCYVKLISY